MSFTDRLWAVLRRIGGEKPAGPTPPTSPIEAADVAGALSEADLSVLSTLGRCTACRACDVAFDGYAVAARPVFRGPSELVLAYARSFGDYGAAKGYLESLRRGDLEALTEVCPVRIPFVALSDLVSRRVEALAPDDKAGTEPRAPHDPG